MTGSKIQKTPGDFPVYVDSLKQAVAELRAKGHPCDLAHLQKAKQARPEKVFRGTRVYFCKALFDWLDANPFEEPLPDAPGDDVLEPKEVLERRKLREQFLTARKKREILDGEHTANSDIARDLRRIGSATRASLQRLRADGPTWEGLAAHEIEKRLEAMIDKICEELHDSLSELYG